MNNEIARLNEQLEREVAEYDMLMETTGVCIVKIFNDGPLTLEWWNEATQRLFGLTNEQFEAKYGYDIASYLGKDDPSFLLLKNAISSAIKAKQKGFRDTLSLPIQGKLCYLQGGGTFTDFDPKTGLPERIYIVFSDVTAMILKDKEQSQNLQKALSEAEKANEAKSTFLSSMSHDLRTPLNGVLGFTDLALAESDPLKKQAYIEKIKISGQLLLSLVNDTLDLSRIESGKMSLQKEVVNCDELMNLILTTITPVASAKNITIKVNAKHFPHGEVYTDKLKLEKLTINLISNAIKYTPNGGQVQVEVEKIKPTPAGYNVRLSVEDTGIGMSEDFIANRLFEPFSQEDRPEAKSTVGTGLGLSIVKRIVTLLGGEISVQSKINVGSRFTVLLPLQFLEKKTKKHAAPPALGSLLQGKKVLLCEDNTLNAEIATILLKNQGMSVDWCQDGATGVKAFQDSLQGYYDAIFMDIRMPVLDGRNATMQIRKLERPDAKRVPIIAMTADAFESDIAACKAVGMNDCITKPIEPDHLFATLVTWLKPKRGTSHGHHPRS